MEDKPYKIQIGVKGVYYITAWDENITIYDNMYKDLIFENKEEANALCKELNYKSD